MFVPGTKKHMRFFRKFAELAYDDNQTRHSKRPQDFELDLELSTTDHCVFVQSAEYAILCVRGTDIGKFKDIIFDIALILSITELTPQFNSTLAAARRMANKYPGHRLYACGHSSGAAQCMYVHHHLSGEADIRAVGFAAFMPTRHSDIADTACLYIVNNDIISCTVSRQSNNVYVVENKSGVSPHSLKNFTRGISKKRTKKRGILHILRKSVVNSMLLAVGQLAARSALAAVDQMCGVVSAHAIKLVTQHVIDKIKTT